MKLRCTNGMITHWGHPQTIYFIEDVLNIDIKSNDDFYNRMNGPILDTIRISYKDECCGLKSDLKYLLSIKGLRSLEGIMYTHHKSHLKKWKIQILKHSLKSDN